MKSNLLLISCLLVIVISLALGFFNIYTSIQLIIIGKHVLISVFLLVAQLAIFYFWLSKPCKKLFKLYKKNKEVGK